MGPALVYRLALAGGLALLCYGVALWSIPAALVIAGAAVSGAGIAGIAGLDARGGEG